MSIQQESSWGSEYHTRPIPSDSDPELNPWSLEKSLQTVKLRDKDLYASILEFDFSKHPLRDARSPQNIDGEYIVEDEVSFDDYLIVLMNQGLRNTENLTQTLEQLGQSRSSQQLKNYLEQQEYTVKKSEDTFDLEMSDSRAVGREQILRQLHDDLPQILENAEARIH